MKIKINEQVCAYLQRLQYEVNGYQTLLNEFTMNTLPLTNFTLNEEEYKKIKEEYLNAFNKKEILIEEIREKYSIKSDSFTVDFNDSIIVIEE